MAPRRPPRGLVTRGGATGLWDLAPAPGPGIERTCHRWQHVEEPRWDVVLLAGYAYASEVPEARAWLVEATIRAMADDAFDDGAALRKAVGELLAAQALSTTMLCRTLEDLFLAGGLRQAWPVALAITDDACAALRRPAGLATLLRTLTRYVPEVPRPQVVPEHLAALAAGSGRTKAEAEARQLVTGLLEVPADEVAEHLPKAGSDPAPRRVGPPPIPRGLWRSALPPLEPLPATRRLATPADDVLSAASNLDELGTVLAGISTAISRTMTTSAFAKSTTGTRTRPAA